MALSMHAQADFVICSGSAQSPLRLYSSMLPLDSFKLTLISGMLTLSPG